ncbi:odorant receptor 49b-like [Sitophilus oryzae]|uniref:Odorant receptor n=1 Tax=Sitophilus oryzae TaxID=7048 RepID=A0A6J2Y906_SITOR|nr:odorant receptor 49b-like [Sitophilus oryzae]
MEENLAASDFDVHYHLKFVRKCLLLLGIWPLDSKRSWKPLYTFYFWLTFVYYIIFDISGAVLAIKTWSENYLTTASSFGIVIEYVSNAYKVLIFKSKTYKQLIAYIAQKEKKIFNSQDEEFLKIYKENAAFTRKIVYFYVSMGSTGISLYFITPLISNVVYPLGYNNITGVKEHHFIVFSYFPFDANRYYWAAYLIQFTGCFYGYAYIVYCGAFYITLITFVTGELKILQHLFVNFRKYSNKFQEQYSLTEEQSQILLLKKLVKEHLKIIRFVEQLNDSIKLFMLLNFVISSFQLSLVVYQILQLPLIKQITVFSYFITLSTQLFLVYNSAHEISVQSENVATSIFKSDWYTYSPKIKRMMLIVCIRSQKPLVMTIGPTWSVQVTSLFQIFKALYSYVCIIMRN